MSLFDRFLGTIRGAMEGHDLQKSEQLLHEEFCTCHRCVFVRGIRGELRAYEKVEAKLQKIRAKKGP